LDQGVLLPLLLLKPDVAVQGGHQQGLLMGLQVVAVGVRRSLL
jgi:hypothetical protein